MTGEKDYYKDILRLEPDHGPKGDGAPKMKEMLLSYAEFSDELIEVLGSGIDIHRIVTLPLGHAVF